MEILRDPIWQFIGVMVAIFLVAVPTCYFRLRKKLIRKPKKNLSNEITEIKIGMSQTFAIMLPLNWTKDFNNRMITYYELKTSIKLDPANTREAIKGILEGKYNLAVICTSLQDVMYTNKDINKRQIFKLHEEVITLDGFCLIMRQSDENDPLISAIRVDNLSDYGGLYSTKAQLLKTLRDSMAETYSFAVRESGSGTRAFIESHILTGFVTKDNEQYHYGKSKNLNVFKNNIEMVTMVAENDKVLAIVADSILNLPTISEISGISKIRILGVDRPFCLLRKKALTNKEVLKCSDYIREVSAMFRFFMIKQCNSR